MTLQSISDLVTGFLRDGSAPAWLQALVVLVLGLLAAKVVGRSVYSVTNRRLSAQHTMLLRRAVSYSIVILAGITALRQLGFDLSILLGAAGILTVAVGFASQTSASNLISGLFLLGEQPFVVGDIVRIEDTTGTVESIDLLSVKLRTFDNLFVRFPNETLLKAKITTLTRYPIRRADLHFRVPQAQDLARLREGLVEVADQHPGCFVEPRPALFVKGYDEVGVQIQFSFWAARERFIEVKTDLQIRLLEALRASGVELAVPRRIVALECEPPSEPPSASPNNEIADSQSLEQRNA